VTAFLLTLVAFALAGCGGVAQQPAALETGRPAASQAGPDAAAQPSKTAADQARLNEQVSRIAGELSELQNAVAKLIASSRQQEDQLTYLRRRVEELESLNRGRLPAGPLERVHFAVKRRAALLHAAVVAAADDPAAMDEHGADGNAAFGQTLFGFLDGRAHELVGHASILLQSG